ncbi:hypothetical protein [Streptomyces sp. NBC_00525]|uniref:hypothetical protein n=1 Tax=Streptomyces sp. NBC_00525 TaxID=2903660 RepID=UPI002E8007BB|nr:hypothetical protein [Streptomyces sp. NBC_00525]WUC98110.1 hypothetical protein OG710_31070 [Streptomyces sp. NBC_00525]
MHTSRHTPTADQTPEIQRPAHKPSTARRALGWIARRRTALLYNALRGAACATGAGVIGLGFYVIRQQI